MLSYTGNYDDYIEAKEKEKQRPAPQVQTAQSKPLKQKERDTTEEKKVSRYTIEIKIGKLEEEIEELEEQRAMVLKQMEAAVTDYVQLAQLEKERKELDSELEYKMSEWTKLFSCNED